MRPDELPDADGIVDLRGVAERLVAEARTDDNGRSSVTAVHGDRLRTTVIALTAGSGMGEHNSPPAATLQVVAGRVRVYAGERSWEVGHGHLMDVPDERHGVDALEDSVLLLTVALD
jgi:quercetin dioxygenase-like cupin family protein